MTTRKIAKNVAETSSAVDILAKGVAESAIASQEINQNIAGVDEAARQSSSGAAQTMDAGATLTRLASQLETLVGQFKVTDSGATAA